MKANTFLLVIIAAILLALYITISGYLTVLGHAVVTIGISVFQQYVLKCTDFINYD